MAKKTFNPADFLHKEEAASPTPRQTSSSTFIPTNDVATDIHALVEQIETSGTDITVGYDNWRDIGFALVEAFGEEGREFYHRISRFHPKYNSAEADKQYTACLHAGRDGITPRTLFYIAQQHGITVRRLPLPKGVPAPVMTVSSISSKSSAGETAEMEDMEDSLEQIAMPTFSDKVSEQLPDFLKAVVAKANSPQDADMLILGTITVISACMPNVYGLYDDREVYPNLFLFVTALASAGKGRLSLCRQIVQPIHEQLAKLYEAEMEIYESQLAEHAVNHSSGQPPQKPPRRVLFIPANSSSTKFYKTLKDNGEIGIMFETEGDTLVNAFKSDYGNYSDGFRKAFHHETITYSRVKDDEYAEIKKPRLSALLSGTPRQIQSLIPDAENGLFSRFIFYCLNVDLSWRDVFAHVDEKPLDDYFRKLGENYFILYQALSEQEPMMFGITPEQRKQFHDLFQEIQNSYVKFLGYDFLASVRRLGLITYRIAMILSVLRIMEMGSVSNPFFCENEDFDTAVTITRVLIQHTSRVFQDFPKDAALNPASQSTLIRQRFFDALPAQFDRSTYISVAQRVGMPPKTAEKAIARFKKDGLLIHETQNRYSKR